MSLTQWYDQGLRFKCTQCGQCCTGDPGFVWLDDDDIDKLASHFHLEKETFLKRYTCSVNGRVSLLEDAQNYDCILLNGKQCTAYNARPKQCQRFPWWKSMLQSKQAWEEAKEYCEGIDHAEGKLYSKEEIETLHQE